jgi:hypothetical protein
MRNFTLATITSLTAGIVNYVVLSSTQLSERAFSFLFEGLLNIIITPGVYLALMLHRSEGYIGMLIIIGFNMLVFFLLGRVWERFWMWIKRTS